MATIEHNEFEMPDETAQAPAKIQEPKAVATVEMSTAVSPFDLPTEQFMGALTRRKTNRQALIKWVWESLVDGSDYGRIHVVSKKNCEAWRKKGECNNPQHWSKPALFLPGAQKITGMLALRPDFPTLPQYEQAPLTGVTLSQIILRCDLLNSSGEVVATGVGGRSLEQDWGDLNKSLKMCQKSSLISATLICAGLSEIFTQDDDTIKEQEEAEQARAAAEEPPEIQEPQRRSEGDPEATLSEARQNQLLTALTAAGIEHSELYAVLEVGGIGEIKGSQSQFIRSWIATRKAELEADSNG